MGSSPVVEKTILNDNAVGHGDSVGEVIDTESNHDDTTDEEEVPTKQDKKKKKSKTQIHRPCPFCPDGKMQSALTRHL